MKGLDDWITGKNDPSAPFNQVDFVDKFDSVIYELGEWLTDEMLEDDKFISIAESILESMKKPEIYYGVKAELQIIKDNAKEISEKLKQQYDNRCNK